MKRTRIFQVWIFLSLIFFTLSSFGQAVSGTLLERFRTRPERMWQMRR